MSESDRESSVIRRTTVRLLKERFMKSKFRWFVALPVVVGAAWAVSAIGNAILRPDSSPIPVLVPTRVPAAATVVSSLASALCNEDGTVTSRNVQVPQDSDGVHVRGDANTTSPIEYRLNPGAVLVAVECVNGEWVTETSVDKWIRVSFDEALPVNIGKIDKGLEHTGKDTTLYVNAGLLQPAQ